MSDLEQLQKNLTYKIKAQDIGFNSWQGSHGKPQKMFIPTKDYLLNSASKQQDEIKKRNEMMEDYLDEQRTPIVVQDDEGNIREYKYHTTQLPTLEAFEAVTGQVMTPDGLREFTLNPVEQKKFLNDAPELANRLQQDYSIKIEDLEQKLSNEKIDFEDFKINYDDEIKRLNIAYERDLDVIMNDPKLSTSEEARSNLRKIFNKGMREIKQNYNKNKNQFVDNISIYKNEITDLYKRRYETDNDINELLAKVRNEQKKNEKKVKDYAEELNNLNRGALDTVKQFNETDEEYFERLKQIADIPFADRRSEEKALMREKDKLRDNLKLIIRDNAKIGQVINSIASNEPLLMYEANKFFSGFKDYFIKKYGENNEKINFQDIINELTFYLKRSTDPRILSGNVTNPEAIAEAVVRNMPSSLIPFERGTRAPASTLNIPPEGAFGIPEGWEEVFFGGPPGGVESIPSESFLTGAEESGLSEEEGEVSEDEPGNKLNVRLIKINGVSETMEITNSKGKTLFIKWYTENLKIKKKEGKLTHDKEFIAPIFFISETGKPDSYSDIGYKKLVDKISTFFGVTKTEVYNLMGIRNKKTFTKEDLSNFLGSTGLLPTLSTKPKIRKIEPLVIGYGIKRSQDLPDKVPFGSNILFLKKLFLKNILSIQNKHNTKINGFNNVHVSDNFVKIIMNLLKGINFTNSELQNLSNGERLLLDNLLMLSELNKKFVTGSATTSLNQLKKDYEILIGEIEAGNNNEILKKKLYNLLMRMVHFGALSQIQALKHYKEILKSHF